MSKQIPGSAGHALVRSLLVASLSALVAGSSTRAQSLTQSPLVLGQGATQTVDGAAPGGFALFLYSLQGAGPGVCLGPEANDCLGLLDPVGILATRVVNGSGVAANAFTVPSGAPLAPVHTQALLVSTAPGGLAFATSHAISASIEPLSALSDEFNAPTLGAEWQLLHPELAEVSLVGGALRIRPTLTSPAQFWFQDGEGVLVAKSISGDFDVRTRAFAHAVGSANPPPLQYRLGGISVRNPLDTASGTHDFVHIAVGAGDNASGYAVEHKTTVDSVSQFGLVPAPHQPLDLRIVRTGASFALSWKLPAAANWTPLANFVQPGMPATVQVGLMAYCASAPLDLEVDYEWLRFEP
jgi:hypothetical protein